MLERGLRREAEALRILLEANPTPLKIRGYIAEFLSPAGTGNAH